MQLSPGNSRSKDHHIKNDCLPIAAIFGANASGKSSVVNALRTLKELVVNPYYTTQNPIHCWDSESDITHFEIVISIDHKLYKYTLAVRPTKYDPAKINGRRISYRVVREHLSVEQAVDQKTGEIDWAELLDEGDDDGMDQADNAEWNRVIIQVDNKKKKIEDLIREIAYLKETIAKSKSDVDEYILIFDHIDNLIQNETSFKMKNKYSADKFELCGEFKIFEERYFDQEKELKKKTKRLEQAYRELDESRASLDSMRVEREHRRPLRESAVASNTGGNAYLESRNRIVSWFISSLVIIGTDDYYMPADDDNLLEKMNVVLNSFDVGIKRLGWMEYIASKNEFESRLDEFSRHRIDAAVKGSIEGKYMFRLMVKAQNDIFRVSGYGTRMRVECLAAYHDNDSSTPSNLSSESDGTRRIIDMSSIIMPNDDEVTFVVDELNRRLHPKLTMELIRHFLDSKDSSKQLILTTHETHLMTTDLFRLDEIWAMDRKYGVPELIPFDQLKIRSDRRLEKMYLIDCTLPGVPHIDD